MDRLRVASASARKMIAHAQSEAPVECCGVLTGRHGTVMAAHPVRNLEESALRYTIDPAALARIYEIADRLGHDVIGFYHSHTSSDAYPSQGDIEAAPPSDLFDYCYAIVSVEDRDHPVLRCFEIADRKVREIAVEVIEGAPA